MLWYHLKILVMLKIVVQFYNNIDENINENNNGPFYNNIDVNIDENIIGTNLQ